VRTLAFAFIVRGGTRRTVSLLYPAELKTAKRDRARHVRTAGILGSRDRANRSMCRRSVRQLVMQALNAGRPAIFTVEIHAVPDCTMYRATVSYHTERRHAVASLKQTIGRAVVLTIVQPWAPKDSRRYSPN